MQALSKAALLAVGLSISGTAIADQNLGGPPQHNPQYAYGAAQYSYGTHPAYSGYYGDTRITRPTVDMVTQLMDGIPRRHTLGRTPTGIRRPHIPG
jgi:hypothetical protein